MILLTIVIAISILKMILQELPNIKNTDDLLKNQEKLKMKYRFALWLSILQAVIIVLGQFHEFTIIIITLLLWPLTITSMVLIDIKYRIEQLPSKKSLTCLNIGLELLVIFSSIPSFSQKGVDIISFNLYEFIILGIVLICFFWPMSTFSDNVKRTGFGDEIEIEMAQQLYYEEEYLKPLKEYQDEHYKNLLDNELNKENINNTDNTEDSYEEITYVQDDEMNDTEENSSNNTFSSLISKTYDELMDINKEEAELNITLKKYYQQMHNADNSQENLEDEIRQLQDKLNYLKELKNSLEQQIIRFEDLGSSK